MQTEIWLWRAMLYGVLLWAVTIYAFRRGGWAEKLAAIGMVLCAYLTPLFANRLETLFREVESGIALVDLGLLILLAMIALRSRKFWPLWLTALQGITLMAHLGPYFHVHALIYRNAASLWSWPMLIILAVGVRRHSLSRSRNTA